MNFLNMMARRLTDKFDPNSAGFGGSGVVGNVMRGDGGVVGGIMGSGPALDGVQQEAPGIVNADATRNQDALARSRGFQTYDQMINWARQREAPRSVQTIGKGDAPAPGAMPQSWGQAGQQAMAVHPRTILDWVRNQFNSATGNGQ